jgi:hypothetical protein
VQWWRILPWNSKAVPYRWSSQQICWLSEGCWPNSAPYHWFSQQNRCPDAQNFTASYHGSDSQQKCWLFLSRSLSLVQPFSQQYFLRNNYEMESFYGKYDEIHI